jgi:hypothetical protein
MFGVVRIKGFIVRREVRACNHPKESAQLKTREIETSHEVEVLYVV